jgi:hypothetical protein
LVSYFYLLAFIIFSFSIFYSFPFYLLLFFFFPIFAFRSISPICHSFSFTYATCFRLLRVLSWQRSIQQTIPIIIAWR